ncbi:hypothetical protein J6590_005192 [Homalodisca vitripennis]|nr:hypothetical protein J6590_005192 [Homalodisca vitripennis]
MAHIQQQLRTDVLVCCFAFPPLTGCHSQEGRGGGYGKECYVVLSLGSVWESARMCLSPFEVADFQTIHRSGFHLSLAFFLF